ncbi:MAG: hypothetical protein M3170_00570 [Candidatus Dormibacteraeota bacterium]|nr:hypothetical protein [Candidatus Dormibacteraeota bacterium]
MTRDLLRVDAGSHCADLHYGPDGASAEAAALDATVDEAPVMSTKEWAHLAEAPTGAGQIGA